MDVNLCFTTGCGKPSTLKCPICKNKGLDDSYFCSQECFKKFWPIHKLEHEEKKNKFNNFKFTGPLRPGEVSQMVKINKNIDLPDHALTGLPKEEMDRRNNFEIFSYNEEEIKLMREVNLIARKALDIGHSHCKPGVTTDFINNKIHDFIIENDAYPSPLNYHKFPKSCCTSVNEVICHGIPDNRPLKEGDILNIDVSVYKNKFHADLNETYCIGKVEQKYIDLIETTYNSMMEGIKICKPETMYREIGNVIGKICKKKGYGVVKSYCGHGTGKLFHCEPNVAHYEKNKSKGIMKEGHVFTIEPMVNEGSWKDLTWPDEWTSVTIDGKRSAQFEHTILITKDGVEILSKRLPTSPPLDFEDKYTDMYK